MTRKASNIRSRRKRQTEKLSDSFKELQASMKKLMMELEASELLRIVNENTTILQRFDRFVDMLHEPSYLKRIEDFRRLVLKDTQTELPSKQLGNDEVRPLDLYIWLSLTLRPESSIDEPIYRAFAKAKLDPEDPLHWRLLMRLFCWSVFPPPNSAGRPPVWTDGRYCKLLEDAHNLGYASRERSDLEISKALEGYAEKPETLREALPRARDPKCNRALDYFVRRGIACIMKSYKSRTLAWPPADLECIIERIRHLDPTEDISSAAEPPDAFAGFTSAFQLFNKLRADHHRSLVLTIRSNGFEADPVEEFLVNRRSHEESSIRDALTAVPDYDASLNMHAIPVDEVDPFEALADQYQRRLESLEKAVAAYYCDRIAKGEVDLSEALRAAEASRTFGVG